MPVPVTQIRVVLSTAGSREEGERIAHALVDQQLAACVNILPGLTSIYRWQGKVESAREILLVIKTSAERLEVLESELHRLHSYEVPEFLVLNVESGSSAYLEWLEVTLRLAHLDIEDSDS
jgi:periplasmic divalent cation tolerance protein